MTHLLVFGLGYTAKSITSELQRRGWQITATSRSKETLASMEREGIRGLYFDAEVGCAELSDDKTSPLHTATHILVSIPPYQNDDPVLMQLGHLLRTCKRLEWIGYLSTIGVYGDHQGRWVDETTDLDARSARSKKRIVCEQRWSELAETLGCRFNIFRLAGIYGPGRGPLNQLRLGRTQRIVKPGQVFNRIHVDDIRQAVVKAIDGAGTHATYNLCDDEPAPGQDVITYAAQLLDLTLPPPIKFEDADLSEMARSFYADVKRVKNDRMKNDLGLKLAYPSYREGLRAILDAEKKKGVK